MYFDGALNLEGEGAGVLFISPRGTTQVRPANPQQGLQQRSRVQSPDPQAPNTLRENLK
jgi:hypothetical protein